MIMKKDKILHLLVGMGVSGLVAIPIYTSNYILFDSIWAAFFTSAIAGGVKEWCDNIYSKNASIYDWLFTVLGGVITIIVILCMHFGKG